ncbi:hypothetical protein V6R21_08025 [Limibacter armeniacum]|uniref:hypothetical protein n=1 Tax=Limibacter armeniacum TaxID=466084 RepID=UPI002FE5023F
MTEELRQNIIDFQLGKLSKEELTLRLPFNMEKKHENLEILIDGVIESKDSEGVEFGLTLIWLLEENKEFTDLIHKIILQPWHSRYEDLIHDIQRRKENTSVPIIKEVIQQKFDFLESYETGTGQFISQCGYALFSIGTDDAINTITELSNSDNEMIKREMNYQLKRLAKNPDTEDSDKTPRWWT